MTHQHPCCGFKTVLDICPGCPLLLTWVNPWTTGGGPCGGNGGRPNGGSGGIPNGGIGGNFKLYLFICLYLCKLTPKPGGGSGIFGGGIGGPPFEPPFGGGFPESIAIASSPWSNVH